MIHLMLEIKFEIDKNYLEDSKGFKLFTAFCFGS